VSFRQLAQQSALFLAGWSETPSLKKTEKVFNLQLLISSLFFAIIRIRRVVLFSPGFYNKTSYQIPKQKKKKRKERISL